MQTLGIGLSLVLVEALHSITFFLVREISGSSRKTRLESVA